MSIFNPLQQAPLNQFGSAARNSYLDDYQRALYDQARMQSQQYVDRNSAQVAGLLGTARTEEPEADLVLLLL
jgi:hypothetical protein